MANLSLRERIAPFLCLNAEGTIDVGASSEKFKQSCLEFFASQEANDILIRESLSALFDQFKGVYLNSGALASLTIQKMQVVKPELNDPALFGMLSERIDKIVHDDMGEVGSGKTFTMRKGKNGGFARAADIPVKPVKVEVPAKQE